MISVPVTDIKGKELAAVEVDEAKLGGEVRLNLMREAVQMYEMNQHVCTKATLTRGEVAGTYHKMYRQKGTGNARAGQRQVPHRRGGGVAFAHTSRNLTYHMPRKSRRLATQSAILSRLTDQEVRLVDQLAIDTPRTKTILEFLKAVNVSGKTLLVCDGDHTSVWKSARNITGVKVCRAVDVNTYDLLEPDTVIFTQSAFQSVLEAYGS
jgi:large subunit ribosomal protein L4